MMVKVIYKCNCGFNGSYEVPLEGGAVTQEDGLQHRQVVKHLALAGDPQHVITLWGSDVTPPGPVSPNGRFVQGR